jgi:hypothetical protein
MLKPVLALSLLAAVPAGAAHAATIVLLPEPGSMSPPTIIVDPRAKRHDPVLVCTSLAQVGAGGCVLQSWSSLRRGG